MSSSDDRPRQSPLDSIDPPRNFTITTEERVRALSIGVPAWSARKRRIEDTEEKLVFALVALHDKLVAKGSAPRDAIRAMRDKAATVDLAKLAALVEAHNRYYPVEANLPLDPRTGAYLARGREWTPEPPPSVERLVAMAEAILTART